MLPLSACSGERGCDDIASDIVEKYTQALSGFDLSEPDPDSQTLAAMNNSLEAVSDDIQELSVEHDDMGCSDEELEARIDEEIPGLADE